MTSGIGATEAYTENCHGLLDIRLHISQHGPIHFIIGHEGLLQFHVTQATARIWNQNLLSHLSSSVMILFWGCGRSFRYLKSPHYSKLTQLFRYIHWLQSLDLKPTPYKHGYCHVLFAFRQSIIASRTKLLSITLCTLNYHLASVRPSISTCRTQNSLRLMFSHLSTLRYYVIM